MPEISEKINYKYYHLTLSVHCVRKHHIWLQEFLCPHFEMIGNGYGNSSITFIENTSLYEETLLLTSKSEPKRIDSFALDNSMVSLPYWLSHDGRWIVFEEKSNVLYLVNHNPLQVELLTPVDNPRARICLMRVVRELAMNESRKQGGVFLHAASVTIGDKGIIIAGEKTAGKTSLLLHLLKHPATCYLSNDRLLIYLVENQPFLLGMPTIISIRRSSLPWFSGLEESILDSFFHYLLTIEEAKKYQQIPPIGKNNNFGLTPAQLCTLLNSKSLATSPASILLFPKITQQKGTFKLNKLSLEVAEQYLSKALFAVSLNQHQSDLFVLPNLPDTNTPSNVIKQLISQVSCYECELGLDLYEEDSDASKLINYIMG